MEYKGGNNDNFRRNFREMLDTHRPCMVALLETRLVNHENWLDDFGFSELIEVPAKGQSGGIVVMWKHEVVSVQNFTRRNQEIHATIEVLPTRTSWLFSSIYANTNYKCRNILWDNLENIAKFYKGPWLIGGTSMTLLAQMRNLGGGL